MLALRKTTPQPNLVELRLLHPAMESLIEPTDSLAYDLTQRTKNAMRPKAASAPATIATATHRPSWG
jgi:hypothetical protein